jgi:hypothetical protein
MKTKKYYLWQILAVVVGVGIGFLLVFNVLFLAKVLPHGGL